MNKLETIWDCYQMGGQSIVQSFGNKCLKLYPGERGVTGNVYNLYAKIQNSLPTFSIPLEYSNTQMGGIREIVLSFMKMPQEASDVSIYVEESWKSGVVSEVPFVRGIPLTKHELGNKILTEIKDFFQYNYSEEPPLLFHLFYPSNFKIVGEENGTIDIVCMDCSGDIPALVYRLLEKVL